MNIEKLPSGKYRARMLVDGKRQSVYFDHKPTESEAMLSFSTKVTSLINCKHVTFEVAASEYCKLKKNVLSPATHREYVNTPARLSKDFINMYIDEIQTVHIQKEINDLTPGRRPKTVKNYYTFIMGVLHMYREDFHPKIKLPQGKKIIPYIPNDEEVKKLFEYAQNESDGMFYVPIMLGTYGLRRSEICALDLEDFEGNIVNVYKGMVKNSDEEWVIKEFPKNDTSNRKIPISKDLVELINKQGYVYKGHPNSISDFIGKFCKLYDVKHFSLHKLRHYFCSRLASENIDTETIIAMSGHKTDYVMKTIYRHPVTEKVQEASNKLDKILFG